MAKAWRLAKTATVAMMIAAVLGAVVRSITTDRAGTLLRSDTVGAVMLILVTFVGWVVVRYSQAYLAGDPYEHRYIGRLLATIAAVTIVVVANNLVVLVLAWTATSVALHGLLTFFGDRPVAVSVAHKKFLLARCADISMLGAVVAFGTTFSTLRIDHIVATAAGAGTMPMGARIGIALVAIAALLKCAQLPFHGWLIQVMEAPTPVSALLHAGVVNLGGFVLLRFAPVVDRAVETRALLVVVGTATAVVAALVMTTRISIKVSLAWSTCAQMGFMLMQCGLGIWEMAMLHLLAHSLYKAHAFLGAGGVVRQTQLKQLATKPDAPTGSRVAVSTGACIAATVAVGVAWGALPFTDPPSATIWVLVGIVALSLVPLVSISARGNAHRIPASRLNRGRVALVLGTIAVPLAYFSLHELFGQLVPHGPAAPMALLVIVAGSFVMLFVVQTMCAVAPSSELPRRLYPWIYGGMFLDEAFTRVAFAVWPPPSTRARSAALPSVATTPVLTAMTSDRSLR